MEDRECRVEVRQDRRGYTGDPQLPRGSRDCIPPRAPTSPLLATCALSPSDLGESKARRRSPRGSPMQILLLGGWVGGWVGRGGEKKGK